MKEQWRKWEPRAELMIRYYLKSIHTGPKELKIVLCNEYDSNKTVKIVFHNSVLAYRRINESFTINTLSSYLSGYDKKLHGDWALFKIDHSSYKAWLTEQASEEAALSNATHFCFFMLDDVVDVIATSEPKIELKNTIEEITL